MTNVGHCPLHIEPAAGGTGGHCPAPRVCHGIDIGGEESQAAEGGGLHHRNRNRKSNVTWVDSMAYHLN